MTAHPKKKSTRARRGMRRQHDAITVGSVVLCRHCRHPHLAHHVCENCGYYAGREAVPEKPERPAE